MLPLIIGAAAAAGASWLGWHSMHPKSQLYGRTLAAGSDPTQVALTFDDGPNDPHTLRLLELLEREQVKATFFLIGSYVRRQPEVVRSIVAAGHAIGNHTQRHPNLALTPPGGVRRELEDCQREIEDAVGRSVRLFRPPFGGRRPDVLATARELGLQPVMWSVSGYDWKLSSAAEILASIERQMAAQRHLGNIVLLHDGGHRRLGVDRALTVAATEEIIRRYRSAGMRFHTVCELAKAA